MKGKTFFLFFLYFIVSSSFSQNWQSVGNGVTGSQVRDIFPDTIDNLLYVGGLFTLADTVPVFSIASWDGVKWDDLDSGQYCHCCGIVIRIIRYKDEIYAAGQFDSMGCTANTTYIARWNGSNWLDVGGGGILGTLKIINDELYITGPFDTVGSIVAHGIAKWDGFQWSDVHNFPNNNIGGNVNYMNDAAMYKGELYVAGNFNHQSALKEIAKWNGNSWDSLDTGIKGNSWVNKMIVYNDELYVGGWFYKSDGNAGNYLMKWNGSQWLDIPSEISCVGQIWDMKVYNNKLYIVGSFQFAGDTSLDYYNYVSYDGNIWCALGIKKKYGKLDYAMEIEFFKGEIYVSGTDTMDGDIVKKVGKWVGGNFEDTCVSVVSSNEIESKKSQIIIFPNPSDGKFIIENLPLFSGAGELYIYNYMGQKVYENSFSPFNNELDISRLISGVYFLQIKSLTSLFCQKLIIQK